MSRRGVEWSGVATRELDHIIAFLFDKSPVAALATLDRIEKAAGTLGTLAERGRVVPELAAVDVLQDRELILATVPADLSNPRRHRVGSRGLRRAPKSGRCSLGPSA